MKKKLTMLLLALVMAFGGTSVAVLSGCDNCNNPEPGPATTDEYTVKFVDENGSLIKETKVKSGETVTAEALPEKAGYTAAWVDANGAAADFTKGITANTEFKVQYTANTDTQYKVEHWFEGLDGTFAKDESKTENKTGTTDTEVSATALSVEHFEKVDSEDAVLSGTVAGDGSLVLKVYYKRERVTVTFKADETVIDTVEVMYGAAVAATDKEVPAKDKTDSTEFKFVRWNTESGNAYNFESEVTENLTLVAYYEMVARHYTLDAELYVNNMYFLAMNEEGDAWIDNEAFDQSYIEYNYSFDFKIEQFAEATGTAVVTVFKYNDNGEEVSSDVITPDEAGYYTVVIDKETKITVTGLTMKVYDVTIPASVAQYEVDWASDLKEQDVVLEITDTAGKVTYHENALTAPVQLSKGVYTAKFVKADGNGGYITLAAVESFQVSSDVADENGKVTVNGNYVLGGNAISGFEAKNWTLSDGVLSSETPDMQHQLNAEMVNVVPGKSDFAAVVSYKLDTTKVNEESDPTIGIDFEGEGTKLYAYLNHTGVRIRNLGPAKDVRGLLPAGAGNMLGKTADAYDKVTEVVVKKGDTFYYFLSGERTDNASVPKVDNMLIMYVDAEGVHVADGTVLPDNGNIAKILENGVTIVGFVHEQSKNCFTDVYGWGYTTDSAVIDSYVSSIAAGVTFTGAYTGEKDLAVGRNKIEIAVPEGKVVESLTVNGTKQDYTVVDGGIYFYITVPFGGGQYEVNTVFADGAYNAVITGTVTYKGEPIVGAKVTDGNLSVYTDIKGQFTLNTIVAGSYNMTVEADGYKPYKAEVTDITEAMNIELEKPMMGGTVTIGDKVFGSDICAIKENGVSNIYQLGYDENGNEIHTSVPSSGCRNALLFSDFAAEKFIAKYAITYNSVKDAWIRFCFCVMDGNGNRGSIGYYGDGRCSSTDAPNWGLWDSIEKPPVSFLGNAQAYIDAGKIEVAMIYDNAHVELYVRCVKGFGTEKWYHIYSGDIKTPDGKPLPSGPVAVGIYETQNANSSFYFSDFYISEDIEGQVDIIDNANADIVRDGDRVTVTPKTGYLIKDIKLNGKSVLSDAVASNDSYVYTLPNLWMLNGSNEISVETEEKVADATFTGKIYLSGAPLAGTTVTIVNEEGLLFNTTTGDDGAFTVEANLKGKAGTLKITGPEILDREMTVSAENLALGDINVIYAFKKAVAAGQTYTTDLGAGVEVKYDKTSNNPLEGLTVQQTVWNKTIAWNQPIAENAAFGFTYSFGDKMSFGVDQKGNSVYLDEDVYIQNKIGPVGMRLTSYGKYEVEDNTGEVTDANVFSMLPYGDMKKLWSAGIYEDVSFVFVRKGTTLDVYVKATSLDRYYYVGKNSQMPETGAIQFATFNSSRGSVGTFDLTMKDFFYTEDLANVVPTKGELTNVEVTFDKAEYAVGENAKVTVKATEGYLVTNVTINGEKKAVTATKQYEVELKALPVGISVAAGTVAENALVTISGKVTLPEEYAAYYDKNGTITYENENGIYEGVITDGAYTISVPNGVGYKVKATSGEFKAEEVVDVTAALENKDYALNVKDDGFFNNVFGVGLHNNDGELKAVADGMPNDISVGNVTFVPANQVVEFGYTLKGNLSAAKYPFFGFMVKQADSNKFGRCVYTAGSGDQIGFILYQDWASRLGASDKPWELWKGGFIMGQKEGANLTAVGTYHEDAWCELTFKFKIDGYKYSMWVKGTNSYMHNSGWKDLKLDDWTLCFENLSIYDRYNTTAICADGKEANTKLDQLYDETQPCYFGITHRQDFNQERVGAATYTDTWFTITDKA